MSDHRELSSQCYDGNSVFPRGFALPNADGLYSKWYYSSLDYAENIDTLVATGVMDFENAAVQEWPG